MLCLSATYFVKAQDITKQKEIGLVFNDLNSFGLTYRIGSQKSLWRFNTLFLSGNNLEETADSLLSSQSNIGFGLRVGKEFRKEVVSNLQLRFGADLSFNYSKTKINDDDLSVVNYDRLSERTIYNTGINLVFGFNYLLGDNFILGVELLPKFNYMTGNSVRKDNRFGNGEEINTDISGFNFGLNNSVLLSLVFKL